MGVGELSVDLDGIAIFNGCFVVFALLKVGVALVEIALFGHLGIAIARREESHRKCHGCQHQLRWRPSTHHSCLLSQPSLANRAINENLSAGDALNADRNLQWLRLDSEEP